MGSEQLLLTIKFLEHINDYLIIHFIKPIGFRFNPGQYGVFKHIEEIEGRQVQPFSFVSSPNDDDLVITIKITKNDTPFKEKLMKLEAGDKMMMFGPMGSFSFDTDASSIFIAEGVGIAPFISMMKSFEEEVELIYVSEDEFLFQSDIEELNYVDAKYTNDLFATQSDILNSISGNDESLIYIAGSEGFVKEVKELLLNNYVDENLIVEDNYVRI